MTKFGPLNNPGNTISPLGKGGTSEVEKVQWRNLQKARKRLLPASCNKDGISRFRREIDILKILKESPFVINILEEGEYRFEGASQSIPYYIMELAECDFRNYLSGRSWHSSKGEIIARLYEVALALSFSHCRDVIHRDIKPGNVLIVGNVACLSDFGLGKNTNSKTYDFETKDGVSAGTDVFGAPELSGYFNSVSASADIYSFGVMMYCAIVGELPKFQGNRLKKYIDEQAIQFASLIKKCTELDPDDRYQNGIDLVRDFKKELDSELLKSDDISIPIQQVEFLRGLADAINHGAFELFEDFVKVMGVGGHDRTIEFLSFLNSRGIFYILHSTEFDRFVGVVTYFNSEIFDRNESFAYVDAVGEFYFRTASEMIKYLEDYHEYPPGVDDGVVRDISSSLIKQSCKMNRFEGGRYFVKIFARGGHISSSILKDVIYELDGETRSWLREGFDFTFVNVDEVIAELIRDF